MKFLLAGKHGDSVGLVERLQQEGNEVTVWIEGKRYAEVYDGLVKKVTRLEEGLDDGTVVVFDMVGFGSLADRLRKRFPVFGGSKSADRRELDREYAGRMAKHVGLDMLETTAAMSLDKAMKYVKDEGGRWFMKAQDNTGSGTTYGADDPTTMAAYIQKLSLDRGTRKMQVVLQRKAEGTEVSTEMWFSKGKPVPGSLNGTIETKAFLAGDLGPNVGCQSSMVWAWRNDNQLTKRIFTSKLLRFHEKEETTGPVDVNTIITNDGKVVWLEFTERLGYSAIYALAELLRQPLGKLLSDVARGQAGSMSLDEGFGGAVRVTIPPYPFEAPMDEDLEASMYAMTRGTPVGRLPDASRIILLDILRDPKLDLVTAGSDGVVMEVVGVERTIPELETSIRTNLEGLTLPRKQYRIDFFARALKDYPKVREAAGIKPGEVLRAAKPPAAKPIRPFRPADDSTTALADSAVDRGGDTGDAGGGADDGGSGNNSDQV